MTFQTHSKRTLISILKATKEKCSKNNWHPTREICAKCLDSRLLVQQASKGDLCLPRLLGLAISKGFDGVHHGHEIADVQYEDMLYEDGGPVRLGIHLKSRIRPRKRGLGRSVTIIKALYTQLFYSAYVTLTGRAELDVLGISVPNTIQDEVVSSIQHLVNELGFPFLVIDEEEWLKVVDAVLEQLEMEQVNSSGGDAIQDISLA